MLPVGAAQHDLGRGLVRPHGEVEGPHLDLSDPTAATEGFAPGLALGKTERLDIDLALVRGVGRLPGDAIDLQKVVRDCHENAPGSGSMPVLRWYTRSHLRGRPGGQEQRRVFKAEWAAPRSP